MMAITDWAIEDYRIFMYKKHQPRGRLDIDCSYSDRARIDVK